MTAKIRVLFETDKTDYTRERQHIYKKTNTDIFIQEHIGVVCSDRIPYLASGSTSEAKSTLKSICRRIY